MKRTLHFSLTLVISFFSLVLLAQPGNDICEGVERLTPFPGTQSCPADDGVVYMTSTVGSNVGATPSSPYPLLACGTSLAADVWYSFEASGAINTITVTSGDLGDIQLLGYVGSDCNNLQARACEVGSGSATITIITAPGTPIYLTVAGTPDDPDDQGTFTIMAESTSDCATCARGDNGEIIYNPRNQTGTYACGETVEVCFDLFEWAGNEGGSVEWLHSIVPEFGPGWDVASVVPTNVPAACNGNGTWSWYPNGWTGCNTGEVFPYGFAFESNAGNQAGCGTGPGTNWGDGGAGCTTYPNNTQWCFNIDVKACPPGSNTFTGEDLSVNISVYSDFASGSWNQTACASPTFSTIGSVLVCDDADPLVVVFDTSCPGADDGSVDVEGNGGGAAGELYNFVVRDGSSNFVVGCDACPNPQTFDNLPPGNYTITTTGVISGCPKSFAFEIMDADAPDAAPEFSEVCPGDGPIELTATTTSPGAVIVFDWTGPGGFTATGASVFTADPAIPGTYTVTTTADGCPGDPVDIEVAYLDFDPMVEGPDDVVCFGEEATLTVSNLPAGTTIEWYDPDGSILPGTDETITVITTGSGTQIYQVLVTGTECSRLLDIPVEVADEILAEIVMDPNGQVCSGEDITFTVQMPGGGQFPAGWTFAWDGGAASGSFVHVRNEQIPGQYQVDLIVTNPGGCSGPLQEVFTVNSAPEVVFDPEFYVICGSGSVELIPTITGGSAPFTYLWGPNESDNITTPTLTVDANSPETEAIYVIVTDNNGCISFSNFADVEIIDDLLPVTFADCDVSVTGEITFSWNDVGQDHFEVYVTIDGGMETEISDDYTDLTYTATGLPGGTEVTIRVVPVGGSNGQECPGPAATQTCTVVDCADPAFTLDIDEACAAMQDVVVSLDGDFVPGTVYTLTVSGTTGAFVTDSDFSDGAGGVSVVEAGTYTITLTTTNATTPACDDSATATFTLSQPVPVPTVTCGDSDLNSLEINWNDVGADSYVVTIVSAPAGAMTSESGTTFTATGLNAGESVTITVTAVVAGCPNVTSAEVTCIAQSCGGITPMITTPVDTFCADGSAGLIDLTVDVPAMGTVEWSGIGVTGSQFDPVAAGPGFHDITVVYTEGTCTYPASFELGVEAPVTGLAIDASATEICLGDAATFTLTGVIPAGQTITWTLPTDATLVSGDLTGSGPLEIEFGSVGPQALSVTVSGGVCTPVSVTQNATVSAPGALTTGDCENVSFDQVGFMWENPDGLATSYVVTDIPAGGVLTDNGNSILVTGLAEGESVTIEVTTTSSSICPNPPVLTLTCTAASCPDVTVALDPVGPFCFNEDATVALNTIITSVNNNGMLAYLPAPGVVGTDFVSTGLAVGNYQVIASYNEAGCTFNDTITVAVTALPVATIDVAAGPVCTDQVVGVAAGAMNVGWSYVWNFGADASPATATGAGSHDVTWSSPGTKTIWMIPTDDVTCVGDTVFATIEVVEPLGIPVIGCGVASFTSIEFGWDAIPGAIGYEVTVENGTPFTQDTTGLVIDGLNQGDFVSITVAALGNGPCGNGPTSAPQECEAGSCPTISVTPPANQTFCTGGPANVVTLTASQTGGSGNGTYVFTGPGVTENGGVYTFNADLAFDQAGAGTHQIDIVYSETICTGTASFMMTVTETPDSPFTLNGLGDPLTVCEGEDFLISYSGPLTAADNATFSWGFSGANVTQLAAFENYSANFTAAGVYDVELTVTLDGCPSITTTQTVTVEAPLGPLVISCSGSDLNSVTFTWNEVIGATGYELSDGTILPAGTTMFTVGNLLPGQDTTITLTALSDGACGNGTSTTSQPCAADDCPVLSLDASNVTMEICLENGDETVDLSTAMVTGGTGNGSYIFSGPGVTGNTFDVAAAGGNEAGMTHTITVDYSEEGPCSFNGTFFITVFSRPSAFITEAEPACVDEGVQLIVGSTNFVSNQDITIDFDGGTVIDDGDPDDSVYLVSWPTPGTKTITATVVSNISGCESLPVMREVIIEAPLEAPVVTCPTNPELESITFSWTAVPGATGYEVTANPGGTTSLDAATTTFTIDGLAPETAASVSVIALSDGPCGNSPAGLGACETAPCPGGSVQAITPNSQICLDGEEEAFLLEAELDMGTPSGPFEWSGTGVVTNGDGTYSFDPAGLPAGDYDIMVTYLGEANCTSTDAITIQLFDQPSSDFSVTNNVVCTDTETTVGLVGTVNPDATYVWDFDGAAQSAGANPESYDLSWPTAGTYTIRLTATANGCETFASLQVTVDPPANSGEVVVTNEALCAGNASIIDLNTFLNGQDEGGVWSVAPGSPGNVGGVNIATGMFDAGQLAAGDYLFAYTVQQGSCPAAASEVSLRLLPPPVAEAGPEQRLTCTMGMAQLDGSGSDSGDGFTYRWFTNDPSIVITGGDQPTLDVGQPGTYFLEVTNAIGCSAIDEVIVTAETEAPVMEVDVSNISCFSADDGAILVTNVSGGRAPYTFTLNGEERGASTLFSGLMAQEYNLQITDANGCFSNLILDLTEPDELTVRLLFPGDSTIVDAGDEITIVARVNGGNPLDTLMWMPDSLNTGESANAITFIATGTQMISITVVDELGCSATDREMLLVRKDRPVYFPNAFSPNGDNINDIWFIGGDLDQIEYIDDFFVFDRWGEAVHTGAQISPDGMTITTGDGARFLPNDPSFGWNGMLNGKTMNPQVLVYTATVHFTDGEVIVYKGDFVLMR